MKKHAILFCIVIFGILVPVQVSGNSVSTTPMRSLVTNGPLVFVRNGNLWLALPDGSGLRQLTNEGGYSDPAWSNGGSEIAYIREFTPPGTDKDAWEIGIYNIETDQQRLVVAAQLTPFIIIGNYWQYSNPRWSPDDNDIYYIASDGRVVGDFIHRVDVNTLNKDINFSPFFTRGFDVSPISGWIVYTEFFNGIPVGYNLNLASPDGNTHNVIIPLADGLIIASPLWSPEGSEIAFAGEGGNYGNGSIVITNDSGALRQLYPVGLTSVLSSRLDWSPDGVQIVYDASTYLYFLDIASGSVDLFFAGEDPSWRVEYSSISGRVTHILTGDPIPDVVISDGSGHTTTTHIDGTYSFPDLSPGSYSLSPSRANQLFTPQSRRISVPPDATGVDFVGGGDTDGDGLNDIWEVNGYDSNGDGNIDVDLHAMGADPNIRDIFVEIDYMVDPGICIRNFCRFGHTHEPNPQAMERVVQAFSDQGIHLHVDYGRDAQLVYGTTETWGDLSRAEALEHVDALNTPMQSWNDPEDWPGFDRIKVDQGHFSSERAPIFHYALFAHGLGGDAANNSGISRNDPTSFQSFRQGASDFVVINRPRGNLTEQGGTFMHELGHNLGLTHSGNDDSLNYEPNYLSVMNYLFQMDGLVFNQQDGRLDYSRFESIPDLNENHLNETLGLNGGAQVDDYGTRFFCSILGFWTNQRVEIANDPINWDCSLDGANGTDIGTSINNDEDLNTLIGFNDWPALVFDGGEVSGENIFHDNAQGITTDLLLDELNFETADSFYQPYDISFESDTIVIVTPGISTTIPVTLTNTGNLTTTVAISHTSDTEWFDLNLIPPQVTLTPGEFITIPIELSVPDSSETGVRGTLILGASPNESSSMGDRIKIAAQIGPMAWFEAEPVSGLPPHEVIFTDLSVGEITSWHWDFGDGSVSDQQNPTHVYNEPGSYDVSLAVTNTSETHTFVRHELIYVDFHKVFMPVIANQR